MHSENWDDLRFVLAVADHGSVSAAARALGVNHATVLRRVAAFEERQGATLFDRTQAGYTVASAQAHVIAALREVESATLAVRRAVEGTQAPVSGEVKVTSTDTVCQLILPEILEALHCAESRLRINLISSNAHLDMARMDADIAVRAALSLPDDLIGVAAASLSFAVYASAETVEGWLGLGGNLAGSAPGAWMSKGGVAAQDIVAVSDSFLTLAQMAQAGMGRCALPRFVGDATPGLRRLVSGMPPLKATIWVASHRDLEAVPRIRAVREFLVEQIAARATLFAPEEEAAARRP
ncbi:transcriptional regulator, LysR family [Candidatus Rhodobacter oscarellae]|uniref:Transcriptional regulator, LysR family n=1 Tax=Candidatus Rhodobacter oscarellae TaxID=1675527 RepID=A0A0J9E3H2_9RHOB|nr:LysR family transcriptional regulator [Candidatus Rhodobacter lobularis]KMW57371.1 transcriptional regulator, LysR family [Candidatus Rhodobacter lobularis]